MGWPLNLVALLCVCVAPESCRSVMCVSCGGWVSRVVVHGVVLPRGWND
jgi:hypothetical protein